MMIQRKVIIDFPNDTDSASFKFQTGKVMMTQKMLK